MTTTDNLAEYINLTLTKLVQNGTGEVDIVREFEKEIRTNIAYKFPNNISIRTGFIHQKPYAFFVNPSTICGKTKTELGDILFVIKHFKKGLIEPIEHRASFSQVKITDNRLNWTVTSHQIDFFKNLDKYTFRFGKKLSIDSGYQNITFTLNPIDKWFSHYLLMSKLLNIGIDTIDIGKMYRDNCKDFDIGCCLLNSSSHNYLKYCSRFSFDKFLKALFKTSGIGFDVKNNFSLVDIIYKRLGMTIDSTEEYEGYFEEAKGGFAIIEFNITSDE